MPNDSSTYDTNIKEQYEALGRFVEAFEMMVHEARTSSIILLTRGEGHQRLLNIVFYNQTLSAYPIFIILSTIISEMVHDQQLCKEAGVSDSDRDVFVGVLRTITSEYNELCKKRNDLLHGTWFVGYTDADNPDASEFIVHRFDSTKRGLSPMKLEKNAGELRLLVKRCERTRDWIGLIVGCLGFAGVGIKISNTFKSHEGKWKRLHNGQLEPLQQTPPEVRS
jgi:hypothetical protein